MAQCLTVGAETQHVRLYLRIWTKWKLNIVSKIQAAYHESKFLSDTSIRALYSTFYNSIGQKQEQNDDHVAALLLAGLPEEPASQTCPKWYRALVTIILCLDHLDKF